MGTKVHCESYLPGHYSMRDLNEDSSSSNWSPFYGNKPVSNGQCYNGYLPMTFTNLYPGYDKDALKQTMLEHEAVFKHQVYELHRLYKIQKDMMDEVRRKKLHKHQISMETSSSSSPVVSQIPSEEAQKWQKPTFPLMKSFSVRPSVSGAEIVNSPPSCTGGNSAQAGQLPLDGYNLKECEVSEFRPSKVRKKLFDLHLPADKYIDTAEGEQSLGNKVFDYKSFPPNRNHKIAPESSSKIDCDVDASRSGSCLRSLAGLADLNEPVQVAEVTPPTSVDFVGLSSGHREIKDWDLEAKPKSQFFLGLPKEILQNPGISRNPNIENKGNGWLSYVYEAGHSKTHLNSMHQGLQQDKSHISSQLKLDMLDRTHQPLRNLHADQSIGETWRERVVHELELPGKGRDLSCLNHLEPVIASNISNPYPSVNSDLDNGWSNSISTWGKPSSSLDQKLTSIQMHPPLNSFGSMGRSSQSSTQSHEFSRDKWHLHNSGSKPDFGSSLPNCNGFFHGSSSGSRDVPYLFPSGGSDYMNYSKDDKVASECSIKYGPGIYLKGSNVMDIKSAKEMNLNRIPSKGSSNGVVSQQSLAVIDEENKCEDHLKVLPWLKVKPACKNEGSSTMRDLNSLNLSFLQAASNIFSSKNETNQLSTQNITPAPCELDAGNKMNEEGDRVAHKKILGFPIFGNCTPKKESSSLISTSASLHCTPQGEGGEGAKVETKIGVIDINLACDPESSVEIEDGVLLVDKERDKKVANLRTHIDLNSCGTEDEITLEPSVASEGISMKIAVEIDLEVPALPETEDDFQSAEEQKQQGNQEERFAAEAIVAISSTMKEINCYYPSEDLAAEPLLWFVEVVSSYTDDLDGKFGSELRAKDIGDAEASSSDEFDYFEAMTLKLTEVKEEEYMPRPLVSENPKVEETGPIFLPGRPRRGQLRRGRQRRDFQRDILPGLASLARHEVTEDLQTFGGLMRATGHPWHSGMARRNGSRNGGGRGRRRSVPDPAPSLAVISTPTQLMQQLNNIEVGLEDRSLTGWGKTPRRPRRQRSAAGAANPPSIPLT